MLSCFPLSGAAWKLRQVCTALPALVAHVPRRKAAPKTLDSAVPGNDWVDGRSNFLYRSGRLLATCSLWCEIAPGLCSAPLNYEAFPQSYVGCVAASLHTITFLHAGQLRYTPQCGSHD